MTNSEGDKREPAGIVVSAALPAIPLGVTIAAIGHWWLELPALVWGGLIVAAGNLLGLAGFLIWYRARRKRQRREWLDSLWQEGSDDE